MYFFSTFNKTDCSYAHGQTDKKPKRMQMESPCPSPLGARVIRILSKTFSLFTTSNHDQNKGIERFFVCANVLEPFEYVAFVTKGLALHQLPFSVEKIIRVCAYD